MGKISKKILMRRNYEMKKHYQNYKFSKEYQGKLLKARNYHQQNYKSIECQSKREKESSVYTGSLGQYEIRVVLSYAFDFFLKKNVKEK